MNCSGEEQERLLSLLEKEGAKKKHAAGLRKDQRNGERLGFDRGPGEGSSHLVSQFSADLPSFSLQYTLPSPLRTASRESIAGCECL